MSYCTSLLPTDNGIGDPCDGDFDDDKVPDEEDACSVNHHVTRTDFTRLHKVELTPHTSATNYKPAVWLVDSEVRIFSRNLKAWLSENLRDSMRRHVLRKQRQDK